MKNTFGFFVCPILALAIFSCNAFIDVSHAQTAGVELPSAGITPHSPFYFLDRLGEALQEFFTFSPEAKARLELVFAKERIAEIRAVLETQGVDAPGVDIAEAGLEQNLSRASSILEKEKSKGNDVSALAKELIDDFEKSNTARKEIFNDRGDWIVAQEDARKIEIQNAQKAGSVAQEGELKKQLEELMAERNLLEGKKRKGDEELGDEEDRLQEQMGTKGNADRAIRRAEEKKREIVAEAQKKDVNLLPAEFSKFDALLGQAKDLFVKENYQSAAEFARQARKILISSEGAIDKLVKEKESQSEAGVRGGEGGEKKPGQKEGENIKKDNSGKNIEEQQTKEEESGVDELLRGLPSQ